MLEFVSFLVELEYFQKFFPHLIQFLNIWRPFLGLILFRFVNIDFNGDFMADILLFFGQLGSELSDEVLLVSPDFLDCVIGPHIFFDEFIGVDSVPKIINKLTIKELQ